MIGRNEVKKVIQHKTPLRFIVSRVLWHSRLSSFLTISRRNYRVRFYPSAYSASLWLDPEHGAEDEAIVQSLVRTGDTVIDVGANIGTLTLAMAKLVGESGQVFSIEAHPKIYQYLVGNVRLNGVRNVTTINVACGRESQVVRLTDYKSDDQNSVDANALSVKMQRLDAIVTLPRQREIAMLKIDVEGYEKFVLEGASGLLSRTAIVYFESWTAHYGKFGYQLCDIVEQLSSHGFRIFRMNGQPVDKGYNSFHCENLVATRLMAPIEAIRKVRSA